MPLKTGSSQKTISSNIKELNTSEPSEPREKAIKTYMKKHNYSYEQAKQKLSVAIAMSKASKTK